jgi:uncharacterized coiled-coil protein SlyX
MPESWELVGSIMQMVVLPLLGWVLWTIVNHSKQIIVLEQRVNDSLNQRMKSIEKRVAGVEEKVDEIGENVTECKMVMNDNRIIHNQINQKFDTLINKMDNMDQ